MGQLIPTAEHFSLAGGTSVSAAHVVEHLLAIFQALAVGECPEHLGKVPAGRSVAEKAAAEEFSREDAKRRRGEEAKRRRRECIEGLQAERQNARPSSP